jgi:NitT/TauT family transport system substrate-binding protein
MLNRINLLTCVLVVLNAVWLRAGPAVAEVQRGGSSGSLPASSGQFGRSSPPVQAATRLAAGAEPLTAVRVGWCSKTLSSSASPFVIALQKGWFAAGGITVEVVPVAGSSTCAKMVAEKQLMFALSSVEAAAVMRAQGTPLKYFYTAYQSNIYGMAVPSDSPIRSVADLRGKRIGVVSPGSASAVIARLLVREAQLDPDRDITLVTAGDPGQTATLLLNGGLDVLSQFDMHYALVERAGVKLRRLAHPGLDQFPSNGFLALEATLKTNRAEAVALARGYAMGTIYAVADPEGAVRALWRTWPSTKPAGRDEATALDDGVAMLMARAPAWQLDKVGAKQWGEHMEKNYQAYLNWLHANAFISEKLVAKDLLTSELLKDINNFNAAAVLTSALQGKP